MNKVPHSVTQRKAATYAFMYQKRKTIPTLLHLNSGASPPGYDTSGFILGYSKVVDHLELCQVGGTVGGQTVSGFSTDVCCSQGFPSIQICPPCPSL